MPRNDKEYIKKLLQDWKTSSVYNKFKKELEERKRNLSLVLDASKEQILIELSQIDDKTINLTIQNIIEFDSLDDESKNEFGYITDFIVSNTTKEMLFADFTKTIMAWTGYLFYFEKKESYEICAKIKQVIDIEIREFKNSLITYFQLEDSDHIMVQEIIEICHSKFFI